MTKLVRRATMADAGAISTLNGDVQAIHAEALPWRFKPPSEQSMPLSEAQAMIAHPNNLVFIAEVDGAPAGYAYAEVTRRPETSLHHAYEHIYLHHLTVRPQHRRCGVGSDLLQAVRAAGREWGIDMLALDVWTFNEGARAFFNRHGFRVYNERLWSR